MGGGGGTWVSLFTGGKVREDALWSGDIRHVGISSAVCGVTRSRRVGVDVNMGCRELSVMSTNGVFCRGGSTDLVTGGGEDSELHSVS